MSSIVFIEETVPEKNLEKMYHYRGFPSREEKEKIIKELAIVIPDLEECSVSIHMEITVRKYKNDPKTT